MTPAVSMYLLAQFRYYWLHLKHSLQPWDYPLLGRSKQFLSKKLKKKRERFFSLFPLTFQRCQPGSQQTILVWVRCCSTVQTVRRSRQNSCYQIFKQSYVVWNEKKKNARARKSVFHKNSVVVTCVTLSLLLNEAFPLSHSACW